MDLEKLKELCDRATPGPWRDNLPEIDSDWGTIGEVFSSADRNFICEARDAMPALVDVAQAAKITYEAIGAMKNGLVYHNSDLGRILGTYHDLGDALRNLQERL